MDADVIPTAREAYAQHAWTRAHELLGRVDEVAPLAPEDLELLATSAYMLGRDEVYLETLERAHRRSPRQAIAWTPCALRVLARHPSRRSGARRAARPDGSAARSGCSTREAGDCVERGYLLLPASLQHGRRRLSRRAARGGGGTPPRSAERFGDPDLLALALHDAGATP